ncbi:MAG: hypothetical protein E6I63_10440 [Chloroflexi bacterium]|nr:MAG: hypothetical protein E6I63_10440 [Chloroflexota bacterium]
MSAASAEDLTAYENAVGQALSLVKEARNGRADAATQAAGILEKATGSSLSEVITDLRQKPPDLADADIRLTAAQAALARPGDTADPAASKRAVHDILSQPRYAGMRGAPSLWDLFWSWLFLHLVQLLGNLALTGVPVLVWVGLAGGAGVVALAAVALILRTGWRRSPADQTFPQKTAAEVARDRFAEADKLAAAQDYGAAVRALAAAVATELSGRPWWESSPQTVRELFRQGGRLDDLRPLLLPFEATVYGGRAVDAAVYAGAAGAAAQFRPQPAASAA